VCLQRGGGEDAKRGDGGCIVIRNRGGNVKNIISDSFSLSRDNSSL
jgi:hypothetical protein